MSRVGRFSGDARSSAYAWHQMNQSDPRNQGGAQVSLLVVVPMEFAHINPVIFQPFLNCLRQRPIKWVVSEKKPIQAIPIKFTDLLGKCAQLIPIKSEMSQVRKVSNDLIVTHKSKIQCLCKVEMSQNPARSKIY